MENKLLGILFLIIGIMGYLFKESIVRHNMRIYIASKKNINQDDISKIEKIYRIGGAFIILISIILGIVFLLK